MNGVLEFLKEEQGRLIGGFVVIIIGIFMVNGISLESIFITLIIFLAVFIFCLVITFGTWWIIKLGEEK